MAAVDPYRLCPCGSGEKYKWCCQKIEAQADKVQRLIDNGQLDGALTVCDEGLKIDPCNPLLSLRKALVLAHRKDLAAATEIVTQLLAKHPTHPGALEFQLRLAILGNNPFLAVALLQEALTILPQENWSALAHTTEVLATQLFHAGRIPAAIEHLALAMAINPENSDSTASTFRTIESNPGISPWLRNHYKLLPVSEGLDPSKAEQFNQARNWADHGLWSAAAASFDTLSTDCPEAERNFGICLLWLGDHEGALEALRRYSSRVGVTPDSVDLEALCQLIAAIPEEDRVDMLQWIWPIRDRNALQAWLTSEPLLHAEGTEPIDPADPKSPQVQVYLLLNKPAPNKDAIQNPDDIPVVQGRLLIGQEIAILEAFDDGRLDRLSEWFRDRAGPGIPPAHPKTKRVGRASRVGLALQSEKLFPEGIAPAKMKQINHLEAEKIIQEIWPNLSMPALGQRTPLQAAKDPAAKLNLLAAIRLLEQAGPSGKFALDTRSLREKLGLEPDQEIDPNSDIESVHLSRLQTIPIEKLDDQSLITLYTISHRFQLVHVLERAAQELLKRPGLLEQETPGMRLMIFADLSSLAMANDDTAGALAWLGCWDRRSLRSHAPSQAPLPRWRVAPCA